MGRKININRKRNWLIIRDFTPCQRQYLAEMAERETAKNKVVVGLSKMASRIIHKYMELEGYECRT